MKTNANDSVRAGLISEAVKPTFSTLWLVSLLLSSSCEIEDDFGKGDPSAYYGMEFYTSPDYIKRIIWSAETDEIIAINESNIEAIKVSTKTIRQLGLNPNYLNGSDMTWLAGNILHFMTNNLELVSLDITNATINKEPIDSVAASSSSTPFRGNMLAFNKWSPYDPFFGPYPALEPDLFLYNFDTKKETLITAGVPITFSPDGDKLLFIKEQASYFYYDLQTKAILPANQIYYGNGVVTWTPKGVFFFFQNGYRSTALFNAITNETIGEWENLMPPAVGSISPSGDNIVILKEKCAIPFVTGNCPSMKQYYYLVDVTTNTEAELAYGYTQATQIIISPSENTIALVLNNNSIYLAEKID